MKKKMMRSVKMEGEEVEIREKRGARVGGFV